MPGARIARLHPWADAPFRPAPSITSQPSNASVSEGSTAGFSVTASDALSYQWQEYVEAAPVVIDDAYTFRDLGTAASPSAVVLDIPTGALAVVVHVVGSSDGVSPVNVTGVSSDFTGTFTRVDEPGSLTAVYGCVAWAKITSGGVGKSLTITFGGPNTLSGASATIYFLKDVDPDDFEVAADTAATSDGTTAATASVASLSSGLVIARDVRIDVTNTSVYPSNEAGWTSLTTGLTTATYTNASRLRKLTTPTTGTATATTQDTYGSMVTAISLKGRVWQDVSTGTGGTTSSYTTATTTLAMTGTRYRCLVTGYGGQTPTNTVTLTVTASSGYSLTVTPGSYSVTGSSASLVASRAMSVTPASYAVTGSSANLERGFALSVTPASYSLSGSSASLVASRALSVTPGSYSVVGSDVDLTYTPATTAYELLVTPGSYGLTLSTASLTAERSLQSTPGAYSVTGANAGLTAGRVLTVTPASYAVSAQSASLVASRSLSVTPGAYVLTGLPVELDYVSTVKELIVLPGSYSLAGADVELEYQPVVQSSGHGFVMVDFEPRIWWMRKPKALDEEEAAEKVKEVAKKIERIVVRKIEQGKAIKTPELKAQVKEAIAPQVAQMPGFDWKALYAAILVRLMEQQAQELAQMELERIRLFEQDEEDALILLMA